MRRKTGNKILILIESPGKKDTIEKYLQDEPEQYYVMASFGHVMTLSDIKYNGIGVNVEPGKNYEIAKSIIPKQKDKIQSIIDAATDSKEILLATDPDREGEAISQDLFDICESTGLKIYRISFGEITKSAILSAIKNKHEIDHNLVKAQNARMALDKIIGYMSSPWLRTTMQASIKNTGEKQVYSAGRVQSPAVRLIIDREEEIEKFLPEEYWNITATLTKNTEENKFQAKIVKKVLSKKDAFNIKLELENDSFIVLSVDIKEKKKPALPPLITSSLQRVAGAKYGFSSDTTMKIAQFLYEKGLISYMRTDSVRSSPESIADVRNYLKDNNYTVPVKPNYYSGKSNVQDAHEAIRCSYIDKHPDNTFFEDESYRKIYRIIWERFVGSQMEPAIFNTVTVLIKSSSGHELKANGKTLKSPGWLSVTSDQFSDDEGDIVLPIININDNLFLIDPKIKAEQKFTQPPSRYSEGNLIQELEKKGIGRPSTFSKITNTIKDRGYVELKNKTYHGTEVGKKVIKKLKENFKFLDYDYTKLLEDRLDDVACGKLSYEQAMDDFFQLFKKELQEAYLNSGGENAQSNIICNKCNKNSTVIRLGKFGHYLQCTDLSCKGTQSCDVVDGKAVLKDNYSKDIFPNYNCPKCNSTMTKIDGKFGPFLKCRDDNKIKCVGYSKVPFGKKCPDCKNELYQTFYQEKPVLFCMGYPNCFHREDLKEKITNPNNYSKIDDVPKKTKKILKAANKK